MDGGQLQRSGYRQHDPDWHMAHQLGGDEKQDQHVDEPQRAERLDKGGEPVLRQAPDAVRPAPALQRGLDGHPEQVEVGEVHDLGVGIGAPGAVDAAGQEQA